MRATLAWAGVAAFVLATSPLLASAEEASSPPAASEQNIPTQSEGVGRYQRGEAERYGAATTAKPRANDSLESAVPAFTPPPSGQPMRLRSASGRGPGDSRPIVSVLAPEPCGFTRAARPTLFWHLDRVPDDELHTVFHLTTERKDQPVVVLHLPRTTQPGLQRIDLADYGVQLEPGIVYEWSVNLVPGDDWGRSIFAIAGIRRLDGDVGKPTPLPTWYDAFSEVSGAAPRLALLHAVGLRDLAPLP